MTASPIISRLNELRRRLTQWIVIDGTTRLTACLAIAIAIDFLLDWSFHMDRAQRAVMLLLVLSGVIVIAYRWLMKPLQHRPSDDALCLQIEAQQPELGQAVISALQFARIDNATTGSSLTLMQATVELGTSLAERIDAATSLDHRRQTRNIIVMAVAASLLLGTAVSVLATDSMAIWFNRNVLLGQREWPQDIHFRIHGADDGVITIPRDEDWPIEVVIEEDSRRKPQELWLEYGDSHRRQRMELLDGGQRFRADLSGATAATTFRIIEAKAASDWYQVRIVDRPSLTELKLTATPPAYSQQSVEELPPGSGPFKILKGSRLALTATSNQPLAAATLTVGNTPRPLTISEQTKLSIDLEASDLRDGDYRVDLTDRQTLWMPGRSEPQPLTSREPAIFRLRIAADREPQVQAKLVGVSTLVTERARLPIVGQIADDFAVTKLELQHRRRAENDQEDTVGTLVVSPATPLPAREVAIDFALELEQLRVAPGNALSFVIEATDNNSATGPGIGRSPVFLARIVTDEEFRAALLGRERELRIEFEKQIKFEDELRTDASALLAAVRGKAELTPDQRDQLARFERRQKAIGEDVLKVARRFSEVVTEIRNNRIEDADGPLQTRLLSRIIEPLNGLQRDGFPPVLSLLDRARTRAATSDDRDRILGQTIDAQLKLLERLREILGHMEQAEGFQEAVNQLLEVQKAQQEVLKRTEKEKQEAIRKLLDGEGRPKK